MASPAHCFYCFETLSASFARRESPSLEKVLDLYEQYKNSTASTLASADDVEVNDDHIDDADLEDVGSEDEDMEDDAVDPDPTTTAATSNLSAPQLPSISRLQASTPQSHSSSSSTPSVLSANSSNSQLTNSASTSTTSIRPNTYASRLSLTATYPLFVTWNTVSRSGTTSLRGCIGTFDALPLASGLSTYALTSAFDDTRFSPIPASLLPSLSCELTLLANFESCSDAMDWTLGTHGLRISFTQRGRRYGATYLPHVAVDQRWDKEETVESLMRKAGWEGFSTGHGVARRILRGASRGSGEEQQRSGKPWEEVSDFRAVRYTGPRSMATYTEWKEWRTWAESQPKGLSRDAR